MIKFPDCAFQDSSYPCGYEDNGKLPDCNLCHKIRKASIKEVGNWLQNKIAEQRAWEQFLINIDQINSLLNGNIPKE